MTYLRIIASTSKDSINKKLSDLALKNMNITESKTIWLKDVTLPIYSMDIESEGFPKELEELHQIIKSADSIIFASPEHNGYITSALKNLLDWLSRLEMKYLENKNVLILATSPGRGGATGSIESLSKLVGYANGNLCSTFSLPSFNDSFDQDNLKLNNDEDNNRLNKALTSFKN